MARGVPIGGQEGAARRAGRSATDDLHAPVPVQVREDGLPAGQGGIPRNEHAERRWVGIAVQDLGAVLVHGVERAVRRREYDVGDPVAVDVADTGSRAHPRLSREERIPRRGIGVFVQEIVAVGLEDVDRARVVEALDGNDQLHEAVAV